MKKEIIGITRKEQYSPNHVTNDALILYRTGDALVKYGYNVKYYSEAEIEENGINAEYMFSMVQGIKGSEMLMKPEKEGSLIINSPVSVLNCHRTKMTPMLINAAIPFPKSIVIDCTARDVDYFSRIGAKKLWLKRGDVHAEHKEDVSQVSCVEELQNILIDFMRRGINKAIVQEHLPGDVIKFYSVRGSGFFHWYYLNGANKTIFSLPDLVGLANLSAEALGLYVFGGDAVISPEGEISIIDINDWPSFAPVRDEAATVIGKIIHKMVSNDEKLIK